MTITARNIACITAIHASVRLLLLHVLLLLPYNYVVSVITTAVCIVAIGACVIVVVTAWLILPHV